MTKEELTKENAILRESNKELRQQDVELRKNFARIFRWVNISNSYGTRDENLKNATWAEIFAHVGGLIAARNFMDFEGNISELERAIEEIRRASVDNPNKD